MKKSSFLRTLIIVVIIAANIGCDQVSKNIARHSLHENETINLVHDHFNLLRVENTGAFLSMGDSMTAPLRLILLTILPLILILAATVFLFWKKRMALYPLIAICFIVGGGIGNIYDRIIHGSVTDFMHINFVVFQTGIFNMADVSVMTGMFALLVYFYFVKPKQKTAAV